MTGVTLPCSEVKVKRPASRSTLLATPSRLGPLLDYAEVGQRPLLNPDRRPGPAPAAEGGSDELDVILTSVLITPNLQLAILTDAKDATSSRVRVGEAVAGSNWRLTRLEPRLAVLEGPGGERKLDLRVYDGQGGLPPTALGSMAGGVAPVGGAPHAGAGSDPASGQAPASIAQPAAPRPPITANGIRPVPVAPTGQTQPQKPPRPNREMMCIFRHMQSQKECHRAESFGEAGLGAAQMRTEQPRAKPAVPDFAICIGGFQDGDGNIGSGLRKPERHGDQA